MLRFRMCLQPHHFISFLVDIGSRHSVSILLRSLAIVVDVEAFGTCPLSLLRNANSSVRYVREKRRYTWSSSLLAIYEGQGRSR
jgi:hypothetical protein